jgi:tetratricopeptide (TPR) repeat protein
MNVVVLIVAAALIVVGVVLIVVAIALGTDRGRARVETEKEEAEPTPPTGRTFLDEPLSRDMAEELGSTPKETEGDEGGEESSPEVTPGDSETEEPKDGRAAPVEEPLSADAVRRASYDFRVELAGKLMAAGEFEEAIGEYQKALGLTDKRAERRDLLIEVASANNALHRYEAAAEAYGDAAALADSDLMRSHLEDSARGMQASAQNEEDPTLDEE